MDRSRRSTHAAVTIVTVLLLGLAAPAMVDATQAPGQLASSSTGVPVGGPPVLYQQPPDVPQLQNRDRRFRTPYELVSGTERYVDGEYLYTDFIYDDEDTTYPEEFGRYGNNAADLVEYRMSVRGGDLAVRFSLTTLLAADSTIATVAFDSDRSPSTGSDRLPRDPGVPFPGTDQVLTAWGTGAEWSTWNGSTWDTVPLDVATDLDANQITVIIPRDVAHPTGQWSATAATGLYDPATGGWLPVESTHGADIVNLGFRFDEIDPDRGLGAEKPWYGQDQALSTGAPTTYARVLDFDLLRSRGERDNVPTHGMIYRIFASRLETVDRVIEPTPGDVERAPASEGKDVESQGAEFLSPLQPYALYVPTGYDPSTPSPLTLSLHGWTIQYFWINGQPEMTRQLGADRSSIILSPAARGTDGFYVDEMEHDIFEAWNDVARHYALDPTRTAVTGQSMGGYGTYRLGLLYPHLFSRAVAYVPAGMNGVWIPGITDDETVVNRWLDNARNLPFFHIADVASELTFYPGQYLNVAGPEVDGFQSFESLGYRYKLWSVAIDHFLSGTNYPAVTEFLRQHAIEVPHHVTFARMPSSDNPRLGLVHDRAYWVSDIELRDAQDGAGRTSGLASIGQTELARGVIDVVSLGFGKTDPASAVNRDAGIGANGYVYLEQERHWDEPGIIPAENRLLVNATNIASITIDPGAARVDCNVELDIISDGPLEVNLLGCDRRPAA